MVEFKNLGFVLEEQDRNIVLGITSNPGVQSEATEKVLKLFPSLRNHMAALQTTRPPVGLFHHVELNGVDFYFLVVKMRSDNRDYVNYLVRAINGLSVELRAREGKWAVAPLVANNDMPIGATQSIISGIFTDKHPADVTFYLV